MKRRGARNSHAWPALVVTALTALGFAIRLRVAGQSVFADELSTYWIVSSHDLGGVISTVHSNAEITPPLSFLLTWLTTRAGLSPELLRAPALIGGTASIPLAYLVGVRTVGRFAAVLAAALTALAPFMIYYSAEARGYGLAVALVMLSTLSMLCALDGGRARWWLVYGAASCAAVYTHYTTVFVLAAQLGWLLWAHRPAWRPALLVNAGALVCFLPWYSGLAKDFTSPTTEILSRLSAFTPDAVRIALEHWSIGYPYSVFVPLHHLPGVPALVLLALGLAAALVGLGRSALRARGGLGAVRLDRRLVLVLALGLAAPVGEALVSGVATHLFGTRNLAVSWPGFALALAALLAAAGPRLRLLTTALVVASFAFGAAKMLEPGYQRPDYRALSRFVERTASPGDVAVEGAVISPGPLSGLDVAFDRPLRVFRAGRPQERDHPFTLFDSVVPLSEVGRRAAAAGGRRIFLVATKETVDVLAHEIGGGWLDRYRRLEVVSWPGILRLAVGVYARRPSPRG